MPTAPQSPHKPKKPLALSVHDHLAIALGREAILAGYAVQFVTATTLVAALAKAHAERRLDERLTNLAKPRLLIVDELGYLPLEPDAAHLFFQLVSRRYEKGAMLITSNRTISEWGMVFGDAVVATAILDRLLHHSRVKRHPELARVLAAVDGGLPSTTAAARFGVSVSFIYKALTRRRVSGESTARAQRNQQEFKLAAYHEAIQAEVERRPDATLVELRAWLLETHGALASLGLMHNTLIRLGLTLKKSPGGRRSRIGPMSPSSASPGAPSKPR